MGTPSLLLLVPVPARSSTGFPSTGTTRCRYRHQCPHAHVRICSGGSNQGSPDSHVKAVIGLTVALRRQISVRRAEAVR
ncbi:hypothetical protein B0H14DRAFT_2756184 [Mycena olivaceomarginata]|nr:hypothetical protein B0H14DRAFT_2756184 [Mycena olivaceomarginata]